ncbi:MAG: DUF2000 domain-containing protein [Bacteroidales bacterium]|jgi:hypothetical protein|nr:DUF2000 domain-containing protein [Bacteroidales bacterium]
MIYENKIAIIIKNDLKDWQKLNVTACLASSVAIQFPETHGKKFVNASNSTFLPFSRHPMMIYAANSGEEINRAFRRAKERDLAIGIYTEPLFSTKCEEENHVEISKASDNDQILVGMILYGESKKVNKALDGLKFHI